MRVAFLWWGNHSIPFDQEAMLAPQDLPSCFLARCVQCDSEHTIVAWTGPHGMEITVLSAAGARGSASSHTPEPVAYYLEEAAKCESASARSAAVAMYRAALEQILYGAGYTRGTLLDKTKALEGDAPGWLSDFDPRFLTIVRKLGNVSIHPNGGDITQQARLDSAVLRGLRETFAELCDLLYERPARRASRIASLESVTGEATSP